MCSLALEFFLAQSSNNSASLVVLSLFFNSYDAICEFFFGSLVLFFGAKKSKVLFSLFFPLERRNTFGRCLLFLSLFSFFLLLLLCLGHHHTTTKKSRLSTIDLRCQKQGGGRFVDGVPDRVARSDQQSQGKANMCKRFSFLTGFFSYFFIIGKKLLFHYW